MINIKKNTLYKYLFIIMLFLFSINFKNKPNHIFVILFIVFIRYMYIKKKYIKINSEFILLLICFSVYFFIYKNYFSISIQSFITFWLGPSTAYFVGYNIISKDNYMNVKNIIYPILYGMFVHGVLNMILFFQKDYNSRVVPDIWLKSDITATLQGTFFTMACSLCFFAIFICKKKLVKISIIGMNIFSIYSTLETASRTIILIIIITFLANIFIYILLNKREKLKIFKLCLNIFIGIIILIVIYSTNIFNIRGFYEKSPFYERTKEMKQSTIGQDPRLEFQKKVIVESVIYPNGGRKILENGYAHNLWLDTINTVGIWSGLLLIMYTIKTFITLIKFIECKRIDYEDKYIIFSIYIALFLNFMVEPILEGVPYMFLMMCIINGVTRKVLVEKRRSNENIMVK